MAVRIKDVVDEMKTVISAGDRYEPWEKSRKVLELAGEFLVAALAGTSRKGQAAILMVDDDGSHLSFAYPEHLARGNTMPIDPNSFAGQVVLKRAVLLENGVPDEPHKDFFERIPDPEGEVRTIQKMIASPLLGAGGKVIGVVEVSRTGRESAGPEANFTEQDVKNLEKSCRVFAPFISRTWTRNRGW
ncbi:MAG: GAF domain-containing protein [bacterium]|nr:GAF domain-containing protein [bacterium]